MQVYDKQTEPNNREGYIDLGVLADEMWMELSHHLGMAIVLFISIVTIVCVASWMLYKPVYEAYNTFVVSGNQTTDTNTAIAKRLAKSFDHAFVDSGMKDTIIKELKLDMSSGFPAQVSASALEDTNFFTITVYSEDGIMAQTVLEMIQKYYPDVAKQICGNISLSSIDATDVLTEPMNPFHFFNVVLKGVLGALIVIAGVLFVYVSNKKTIHSTSDIKKQLDTSCIATIPIIYFKKRKKNAAPVLLISNDKIEQNYKEAIHTLRIRVERIMDKEQKKLLLLTSSLPNEGKTTISINLAIAAASRGKKVLLIDGDLRFPSIHKLFEKENLPKKKGLADILLSYDNPEEAIVSSPIPKLDLILGGDRIEDPSNILAGEQLKRLLETVKQSYDYVIFDSSPAAMLSDTSAIANLMDAVLFVIRQDYTRIEYAKEGLALLSESGILSLGCVMNYAEAGLGSYGYGYYGYRYNKYQYGRYSRYSEKED